MAGLVLSALVAAPFLLHDEPRSAVLPAPGSGTAYTQDGAARDAAAGRLLTRLTTALDRGTRAQTVALAAPGDHAARGELAAIFDNVRRLEITDLAMRYVDEDDARLDAAQQRRLGRRAWVGDVELTWRIADFDRATSALEVNLTFVTTPDGAAFVTARGDYGNATPLWLLGRLTVARGDRWLVMAGAGEPASRLAASAERAVADVARVLPNWSGPLVVEAPSTQAQLDQTLGAEEHAYDAIAAVTATVDGSAGSTAPVHVFVNPAVYGKLGRAGRQIVVSHEATHVATGAALSSLPTWLLEGFADYVALAHVDLPVSVTASQALRAVRSDGPPKRLPGSREFDPADPALGASYESAWLACRLIAERYGERKLIDFYRASDRQSSTGQTFRSVLGTSEKAFTGEWRDYLARLAS